MNVTGIIVEYNPFHNGHALHLKAAREATDADVVIAVMSGSFVQRGEPAIVPKWERAQMAIDAGVDIVIELPVLAATQQAAVFAEKAVELLAAMRVNHLFFGSEHGDSEAFVQLSEQMLKQHDEFAHTLQHLLQRKETSYPVAFATALRSIFSNTSIDVTKPNNILGFHYALAIAKNQFAIQLHTMPRAHAGFHDQAITHPSIASATAIRRLLLEQGLEAASHYLPATTKAILAAYHGPFISWADYYPFLQYRLLTAEPAELAANRLVSEGIENRFQAAAQKSSDFAAFLKSVQTKRYSNARIQRTALHILLHHLKSEHYQPYLRILGMSAAGRKYMTTWKKEIPLPIVSTVSKAPAELLELDLRATAVYTLPVALQDYRQADFTRPPYLT
ncbi:Protein of uncharacterised function (DUF795) [Listeria grayi]|uniref:tRNA(Met) cytidine acetate ligase n=1 Tax=Listeria grayi TaxID=1641 RepID=A0A378MP96_LISGR|nr:nucleotidyltransferase [Listeria grayi]STY45545.1 Protein of uncharacterised function (DUF795) [Listeria grayi]